MKILSFIAIFLSSISSYAQDIPLPVEEPNAEVKHVDGKAFVFVREPRRNIRGSSGSGHWNYPLVKKAPPNPNPIRPLVIKPFDSSSGGLGSSSKKSQSSSVSISTYDWREEQRRLDWERQQEKFKERQKKAERKKREWEMAMYYNYIMRERKVYCQVEVMNRIGNRKEFDRQRNVIERKAFGVLAKKGSDIAKMAQHIAFEDVGASFGVMSPSMMPFKVWNGPLAQFSFDADNLAKQAFKYVSVTKRQGDKERSAKFSKLGLELLDISAGFIPVAGLGRDMYEVITGKSLILGRKLDGLEQGLAFAGVMTAGFGSSIVKTIGKLGGFNKKTILNGLRWRSKIKVWKTVDADKLNKAQELIGNKPSWVKGSRVFKIKLKKPVTVWRVHNGTRPSGQWVFASNPANLTRRQLADRYSLPGGMESIKFVTKMRVPRGKVLYGGYAAPINFGKGRNFSGGGRQWYIKDEASSKWIKSNKIFKGD